MKYILLLFIFLTACHDEYKLDTKNYMDCYGSYKCLNMIPEKNFQAFSDYMKAPNVSEETAYQPFGVPDTTLVLKKLEPGDDVWKRVIYLTADEEIILDSLKRNRRF